MTVVFIGSNLLIFPYLAPPHVVQPSRDERVGPGHGPRRQLPRPHARQEDDDREQEEEEEERSTPGTLLTQAIFGIFLVCYRRVFCSNSAGEPTGVGSMARAMGAAQAQRCRQDPSMTETETWPPGAARYALSKSGR